ncbi:MAG: ATP-dependent helicase [Eubacterium sp.]|nr:ATP-dependent helicase [Eubacterium sp.]MCI1405676.1 ATP-dependent helicase [Eubacterium sp.]MCI1476143.1 ATP-dependent helicase [Eubacterium sp.]MCI1512919.1 ATP-dependent helicase [Eubacterium sp.]MCI1520248.1 ATP-dependent helicase [Eubacterium sp.]
MEADLERSLDKKQTGKGLNLSDAQLRAVRKTEGPQLLLAVPGSGKTTTLVARLGYMIREKGIPPESILVITFTRAAAEDMRRRFASFFGTEAAGRVHFSTINSFCYSVVLFYAKKYHRNKPKDETNSPGIIRMLYPKVYGGFSNENDIKELDQLITYIKNMQLEDDEIEKLKTSGGGLEVRKMYEAYQDFLKENYLMDYDDQILFAHQLLSNLEPVREHFQRKFPYVCVDEAQDTSKVQHDVIRLLAGESRNLFMVGDEDQSIYGFRAAYPKALLDFRKNYPGAEVLFLETNYRSARSITEMAAKFITGNKKRYEKKMLPARKEKGRAEIVKLKRRNLQYRWLAEHLAGTSQETAVLYRNNDSAIPLIYALKKAGIPCRRKNMDTLFFQNRVVRDAVEIMEFALNPSSTRLFWDLYYKFSVRITKKAAFQASHHPSRRSADPLLHALEISDELGHKKREEVRRLRLHFQKMRQRNNAREALAAIRFQMDYSHANSEKLFLLQALTDQEETIEQFLGKLKDMEEELNTPQDKAAMQENPKIVLSTIHASKGLEYPRVILMDAVSDILPAEDNDLEEERRIFYVGMTRARDSLVILDYENESCPFIRECSGKNAGWKAGDTVVHKKFGKGTVVSNDGKTIVVDFQRRGRTSMKLDLCIEKGLLR